MRISPGQPNAHQPTNVEEVWPLSARAKWAGKVAKLIVAREKDLTAAITRDVAKPEDQALTGDVLTLLHACKWHRAHARSILKPRNISRAWTMMPGTSIREHRVPMGLVGIIATWNYPVQLLGIQMLQALVAGNRIVVKPSELSSSSQQLLTDIFQSSGIPTGFLVCEPATREAGPLMLSKHSFDHVVFTGSTAVGIEIAKWAASNLVSTTLELSGNDSAIVLADADIPLAARQIISALKMNAGQTCLAPRRVLVDKRVKDSFISAARAELLTPNRAPQPLVSQSSARRASQLIETGLSKDSTVVIAPAHDESFPPTIVIDPNPSSDLVACQASDCFAPVLAVVEYGTIEQALTLHHTCTQHLSCQLYTKNLSLARDLAPLLGASIVMINDSIVPAGHPGVAVVGHRRSGWGASRGAEGLRALTRPMYLTNTTWPRLPSGQLSPKMIRQIRSSLRWLF